MKFINRVVGALVIIIALAFFLLVKVNKLGFLKGTFSDWVTDVNIHIRAIYEDTRNFMTNEGITLPTVTITGGQSNGESYTLPTLTIGGPSDTKTNP